MGCAVRLCADADWDCCSVNKTVRGCSAVVCGKDTDGVDAFCCFFFFLMMSRPWLFRMQQHCLLQFKFSSPQKNVNAFVLIGLNLSVSLNSAMLR